MIEQLNLYGYGYTDIDATCQGFVCSACKMWGNINLDPVAQRPVTMSGNSAKESVGIEDS